MSAYLTKLETCLEHIQCAIDELETTYGGEKYMPRLREIHEQINKELGENDGVSK